MRVRNSNQELDSEREIVGLIPAAGIADRIAPLPCSKELYPVGFRSSANGGLRPKAACIYLLEKMRVAGIKKAFIILRHGKWDIPAFLRDGSTVDMSFAYLIMKSPFGPPYTLNEGYPFVKQATVAFGFPDIIFKTADPFGKLIRRQSITGADVVLGIFPAPEPKKVDMVEVEQNGRVRSINIKPRRTQAKYTWLVAVWTPNFSGFMHEYLARELRKQTPAGLVEETTVGHVFQAALQAEFYFDTVVFRESSWLDIGTPENLLKASCAFL
jgi:glucose-1-phosphate thymidylyltransferase